MKKLISAAASLAMAASMAGSAVPFVTGAADSSKSLSLLEANSKSAAVTISADDIAAGDVTIPVGLYITEATNDSKSIAAQFTVNSKDGDASNVSFALIKAGEEAGTEKTYTKDGTDYTTTKLVNFAGTLGVNKRGATTFQATGQWGYDVSESYGPANTDNAFSSVAWVADSYEWTLAKSDDLPIYVTNVTFPKGTKNGTYTLDFCDYVPDTNYPNNYSCMVENETGKITTKSGGLSLTGMTITIGDAAPSGTTTTAPAVTTTTSAPAVTTTIANLTTTAPSVTTVAPVSTEPKTLPADVADFPVYDDVVVYPKEDTVEVDPGATVTVEYYMDMGSHPTAAYLKAVLDSLPEGFTYDYYDNTCYAVGDNYFWGDPENDKLYVNILNGAEPSTVGNDVVLSLDYTVPTTPGTYVVDFTYFQVTADRVTDYLAVTKPLTVIVKGETPATTTTTGAATTTTAKATTTTTAGGATTTTVGSATTTKAPTTTVAGGTTTTTNAGTSKVLYGDVNVDGKVNIADVVVLNKYLNDAKSYAITDQGKVNADCQSVGNGIDALDSDAIIKSIVHLVTLPC